MKRKWWLISVSGYGEFAYYGTEAEAEEMRVCKANWERGVGRKQSIPATHPKAKSEIKSVQWANENGSVELDERELESIGIKP